MTTGRSTAWKEWERQVARALRGRRVARLDLFESSPDILVPDFGLIVEAKYRRAQPFRHHAVLHAAQRKYARPGQTVLLATKTGCEPGGYVTVPLWWFAGLLDRIREQEGKGAA